MKQTILIIDDDKKLNLLLKSFLSEFDFQAVTATEPEEGLRKLRQHTPDLIILDVMLPGMDGFEVCRKIRQTHTVPIIMLTARGELTDRVLGLELGADDYLSKPFEPRELVARIHSVLRRARKSDQVQPRAFGRLTIDFSKRKDELQELSEAFNTMTERIQSILQSKEQLLLDVSHELRSPLTRLKVALEMMPDSDLKEKIREDVFEMDQMITEILETARIRNVQSALKRERTNLTDLVGGIVAEYADKPPGVNIEDGLSDFIVYIDANKIKIVLNNILSNAVKYSKESSTPVMINLSHQVPYVIVTVIDTGISIPKEELPHIFEPFYRVDKSRSRETGGYGLGLSLCKTIMTAHQGKIAVESSPEEGTKVLLFFKDAESMSK